MSGIVLVKSTLIVFSVRGHIRKFEITFRNENLIEKAAIASNFIVEISQTLP